MAVWKIWSGALTQHKYLPGLGQGRRCCCIHASVWMRSDPGPAWNGAPFSWNQRPPSSSTRAWHRAGGTRKIPEFLWMLRPCGASEYPGLVWLSIVSHHGKDKQLPHRACTNPLHMHCRAQAGDFLAKMNQVFLVLQISFKNSVEFYPAF